MPKVEGPRLRIPTPYERNITITSFGKPVVLIKSIKKDAKRVRTSQSDRNTTALDSPTEPFVNSHLRPWNHAAELDYSQPKDWDERRIISYIFQHGFSIPARDPSTPWVTITGRDGETTNLPRGYRTPLLFITKFQWESLRLIMTSPSRTTEWEDYKYDILHVSRLCTKFLADARSAVGPTGIDRGWRSTMFDRALTRYYRRWLVNRPAFLLDFWYEFGEGEYGRDVLKNDWTRFVLKGHKGFCITKEELQKGISFGEFIKDLTFLREGTVAEVRDAFKEIPSHAAPHHRDRTPTRPSDLLDERTKIKVAQFFRGAGTRVPPTVEEFDLGRFGVHSTRLSSSQLTSRGKDVSQLLVSPSLQIKREIVDEAQVLRDYPNHLPTASHSQIASGSSILRLAREDVGQILTESFSIHEHPHSRPPNLSFAIQHPHSPLSEGCNASPFHPEIENITSDSAASVSAARRLSATAQHPGTTPLADEHHIVSVSDQPDPVNNEPTFPELGTVSSSKDNVPYSGDQSKSPLSETRGRDGKWSLSGIKPSRSMLRGSSTDAERMLIHSTDVLCAPSLLLVAESPTKTRRESEAITPLDRAHEIPMTNVDNSKSNSAIPVVTRTSCSVARKNGVADGEGATGALAVDAINDGMRRKYSAPIESLLASSSINANLDRMNSYLIHDTTHSLDPIGTHVIPTTGHEKSALRAGTQETDSGVVLSKAVTMFRDILGGLNDILEGDEMDKTVTSQFSSRPLRPSASPNSASTESDALVVDELLDEIKGLKREMKKNADDQLQRAAYVQRLHAEVHDMRRKIVFRDSLRRLPPSQASMQGQKTGLSSSPSGSSRNRNRMNAFRSQHPLAHLFAMETETSPHDPGSSSTTPNQVEKQDVPLTLIPDVLQPREYHYPLTSPPDPSNHVSHDDAPLPVKSQRKQSRMFFLNHRRNNAIKSGL